MKNYCTQNEGDCKTYEKEWSRRSIVTTILMRGLIQTTGDLRVPREAVMKIKIEYEKIESGEIRTCITVVDNHDYPTGHIFAADTDYPSNGSFSLEPGNQPYIVYDAESPQKAREFVQEQIEALKRHLEDWRAVIAPHKEEGK